MTRIGGPASASSSAEAREAACALSTVRVHVEELPDLHLTRAAPLALLLREVEDCGFLAQHPRACATDEPLLLHRLCTRQPPVGDTNVAEFGSSTRVVDVMFEDGLECCPRLRGELVLLGP